MQDLGFEFKDYGSEVRVQSVWYMSKKVVVDLSLN